MAITTYAELQTAVANWANRADAAFTNRVTEFITIGEGDLNRRLVIRNQEQGETNVSISGGASSASLPTGFQDVIDFYYDNDTQRLERVPITQLHDYSSTTTGRPEIYAISGSIYFERPADQAYTAKMRYWKALDIASATNWVLTNYPAAYLYAALVAAEGFLKNDPRIVSWKAQLEMIIREINQLDARAREAPLRTDVPLTGGHRYNIYTDQ